MNTPAKDKYVSGLDEAMNRIAHTAEHAIKLYQELPWWNFKERFIAKGALVTLNLVLELVHELRHKWDNQDGRLN